MNAVVKRDQQLPTPKALGSDLVSTLQLAAKAVEGVDVDGYREPGDIAADDAGASRLAAKLKPSPDAKQRPERPF